MKPPVDAPASRQCRPETTIEKRSKAASSLWPPRDTKRGESVSMTTTASDCATRRAGLSARDPPTSTAPCSTRSRALSRESANPRRTSSVSSLRRTGVAVRRSPSSPRPSWSPMPCEPRSWPGPSWTPWPSSDWSSSTLPVGRWVALRPAADDRAKMSATFLARSSTFVKPRSLSCWRTSPRTVPTSASERSRLVFTRSSTHSWAR